MTVKAMKGSKKEDPNSQVQNSKLGYHVTKLNKALKKMMIENKKSKMNVEYSVINTLDK